MADKKVFIECIDGFAPCVPEETTLNKAEVKEILNIPKVEFVEVGPTALFKVGTWNGNTYDRADILEMVTNYHRMKNTWTPSLKVSHDQGYHLTSNENSEESCGKVTDMWEEDGVVLGKFQFDIEFYKKTIAKKKLSHKSVEIWTEMEYDNVEFNNVISNVALLGISMPGCGDLGEIENEDSVYRVYKAKPKTEKRVFEINIDEERNVKMEGTNLENTDAPVVPVEEEIDTPTTEEETTEDTPIADETIVDEEVDSEDEADLEEDVEEIDTPVEEDEVVVEDEATPAAVETPVEEPELLTKETFAKEVSKMEKIAIAKFEKELMAKDAIIAEYQKERKTVKINHCVEGLIKSGHVTPAYREVCTALFNSLSNDSKMNFAISKDETIDEATTLLERFLKTYSVWQTEPVTKTDDIDEVISDSLPTSVKDYVVTYNGTDIKADGVEASEQAYALKAKYKSDGIEKSFIDCFEELENKS